jgi:hypothetical protein
MVRIKWQMKSVFGDDMGERYLVLGDNGSSTYRNNPTTNKNN